MRNLLLAILLTCGAAASQSPLTTQFTGTNGGGAGGTVLFDLAVATPIAVTRIDVHSRSPVGVPGTLEIRTCPNGYLGNETNAAAWTTQSAGNALTTAGSGQPTVCQLAQPLVLAPGTVGVMLVADTWAHAYSNGLLPAPNNTFATAELTLRAGAAANAPFVLPFSPRVADVSIHYVPTAGVAGARRFGTGCIRVAGSAHELFASTAAFDLGGRSMTLQLAGGRYTATAGTRAFVAPGAAAAALPLGDDAEATVPLAGPLVFPGGATLALVVCSNGFVSAAPGNGTPFQPDEAAFLAFPQTVWSCWHDYDPTAPGSGSVMFEEVGSLSIVTWDGVFHFGAPQSTVPNTFQLQFDRATGDVHWVWQSLGGANTVADEHLVGFKCGGAAMAVPSLDLSLRLQAPFPVGCDVLPLDTFATARPVLGTSIAIVTRNVPAVALVTVSRLTWAPQVPPVDLTALGMPGCFQHVGASGPDNVVLIGGPVVQRTLALPRLAGLAGLRVFGQSVSLAPGANALGAVASNGLELRLDLN